MNSVDDIFRFFLGRWSLQRSVCDSDARPTGEAIGMAEFVESPCVPSPSKTAEAGPRRQLQRGSMRLLRYRESGQMTLFAAAKAVSFSRAFDYFIGIEAHADEAETPERKAAPCVQVFFADGPQSGELYQTYFFDASARVLRPDSTHLCLADRYNSEYRLTSGQQFDLDTVIAGPQKDYVLHTSFIRLA
jgi:hypothetical protein